MTEYERDVVETALLAARVERPYYARAIAALTPVVRHGLGTVAVDKNWRLYFDPKWLAAQSSTHRAHLICSHEIEHLLRDHCRRVGDRHATAWNIAGDLEINDDTISGTLPDPVMPSSLGLPDGLLAEEYYDRMPTSHVGMCGGGSGAGNPIVGELGESSDVVDAGSAEQLREQVAQDVRAYVKEHGRGSVPLGVEIWADTMAPAPKAVPWPSVLTSAIARASRECMRGRQDYGRGISRRQREGAPLRPVSVAYRPRIGLVVDTSGSMGNLGANVIGIARSLCQKTNGLVTTYQCDTKIQSKTHGAPKKWIGGGGTDLCVAIAAVADDCDVMVVVSDCDSPWPDRPSVPIIVVSVGSGDPPSWAINIKAT